MGKWALWGFFQDEEPAWGRVVPEKAGYSGPRGDCGSSALLVPSPTCLHSGCREFASPMCLPPSYFLSLIALVAPPSLLLSAETCPISTSLTACSILACSFCSQGPVRWPEGIGLR